jgi:hypothetical protein
MGLLRRKERKLVRRAHQAAVKTVERLTPRQRSIFDLYYQRPQGEPKLTTKWSEERAKYEKVPSGEYEPVNPKVKTKAINDAIHLMNERIKKGQIAGKQLEELGPRPEKAQARKLKISEQPVGSQNVSAAGGRYVDKKRSNALRIRGGLNK